MDEDLILYLAISILLVPFIIGYIFISYVKSLESKDCSCSDDSRRKYVKFYGYLLIILAIMNLIFTMVVLSNKNLYRGVRVIKLVSIILNFLAAYVLFTYNNVLENNDCKCANSWKRVFMKYYSWILIFFTGLLFFCLLMALLVLLSTGDDIVVKNLQNLFRKCS